MQKLPINHRDMQLPLANFWSIISFEAYTHTRDGVSKDIRGFTTTII